MSKSTSGIPIATVQRAGLVTTQDIGRIGFADIGVPGSGAWHQARHRLAVTLVHDHIEDMYLPYPTFEILNVGLSLALHEPQVIAVVGSADVRIDGRSAVTGVAMHISADSVLEIDHLGPGPVYLALSGWQPERILRSAATDSFSRLGGPCGDGAPIKRGQDLLGHPDVETRHVGSFVRAPQHSVNGMSVIAYDDGLAAALCEEPWHVNATARSGVRLSGQELPRPQPIPSMPVVPGAIQLTPDGTAIVLGPDGGLTGGYPIVGVVASAHLDHMADLEPAQQVVFTRIDPASAFEEFIARERAIASAIVRPDALT